MCERSPVVDTQKVVRREKTPCPKDDTKGKRTDTGTMDDSLQGLRLTGDYYQTDGQTVDKDLIVDGKRWVKVVQDSTQNDFMVTNMV